MSALFFGSSDEQLFGYHHDARGDERGAVVLCNAWGGDYQHAHRAMSSLARRLADEGFHVLRFDYAGCGDSWGETTVGDMRRWEDDTSAAIEELQAMSGQTRVDVIGLRLGALLACRAAATHPDIRRVVLWDPVTDGAAWVREMNGEETGMLVDEQSAAVVAECSHRLITPQLLRDFRALSPASYPAGSAESTLLLQTVDEPVNPAVFAHLGPIDHETVPDASPWLEDRSIWSGLVPARAISTIARWMTRA